MKSVCMCASDCMCVCVHVVNGSAICNSARGFSIGLESWSMGPQKERDSGLMVTDPVRDNDNNNNMAPLKWRYRLRWQKGRVGGG